MRKKVRLQSTSAIFVWRALQNFAMADFEENVEDMVGRLEKRRMATESDGNETATRLAVPETRPATRRRRRLVTNEMAATGGVMYTDEGELEFDEDEMAEDEMAALEGQRLVAEFRCGIY